MYKILIGLVFVAGLLVAPAISSQHDIRKDFERPARIEFPDASPYSPQIAALGKMLFFDPRLSGAQNMSCATCHNPSFGWETPVARAIGALNQPLDRHAPTVENLAEAPALFWDGRAATLEEQAVGPITHPKEMNATLEEVVSRLGGIATYRRLFNVAFPGEGLSRDTVLRAIATYQRTLRSGWSSFDDWVQGDDAAISEAAKRGFDLFVGAANCAGCHNGWAFTDHGFHAVGIPSGDPGRGAIDPDSMGMFKTPGLRNVALRAPYMHDGSIATLRGVLRHYQRGGVGTARRDMSIAPLDLTEDDIRDLQAFLESLTAHDPHVRAPALPAE